MHEWTNIFFSIKLWLYWRGFFTQCFLLLCLFLNACESQDTERFLGLQIIQHDNELQASFLYYSGILVSFPLVSDIALNKHIFHWSLKPGFQSFLTFKKKKKEVKDRAGSSLESVNFPRAGLHPHLDWISRLPLSSHLAFQLYTVFWVRVENLK